MWTPWTDGSNTPMPVQCLEFCPASARPPFLRLAHAWSLCFEGEGLILPETKPQTHTYGPMVIMFLKKWKPMKDLDVESVCFWLKSEEVVSIQNAHPTEHFAESSVCSLSKSSRNLLMMRKTMSMSMTVWQDDRRTGWCWWWWHYY